MMVAKGFQNNVDEGAEATGRPRNRGPGLTILRKGNESFFHLIPFVAEARNMIYG